MCPVCLATAVLIAGSATSTGGLAAVAIRKLSRIKNGGGEVVRAVDQRRDQYVDEHD